MSIITLDEAKRALKIGLDDTGDDEELQDYVDSITGAVETFKGIAIEDQSVVEDRTLRGYATFMLKKTPVISLTSVAAVDGSTTWNVANLHVSNPTGLVTVLSGPSITGLVTITYRAGYPDGDVPPRFKRGTLVILQHVWETQRGVGAPGLGTIGEEEVYDPRYSFSIPRKALEWFGNPLAGVA